MSPARNQPSCGVCASKLVKNGTTSKGRTRWRCRTCGSSTTQHRPDITRRAQLTAFHDWLLSTRAQHQQTGSARSFRRTTAWCWNVPVPRPPITGQIHDVVIMDGTYFQDWCLLIATDHDHVIDWQWCDHEKKIAWAQILQRHPAPVMVVIDGGSGLAAALREHWPATRIQRCYFHIYQAVRRHLTHAPRLDAGKELLALTRALMRVSDLDQAAAWMGEYATWEARWDTFLRHRTYPGKHHVRPTGVSIDQQWWYTHRSLRTARALFRGLIRTASLFAWLDPDLPARLEPWPRTTSSLEGGPNRAVKEILRAHRGMPISHARRAVEWKLNSLTEIPADPWAQARPEHWNPPPARPAITPIEDPAPQIGTAFSWEDGNGLRHGWAGRSR